MKRIRSLEESQPEFHCWNQLTPEIAAKIRRKCTPLAQVMLRITCTNEQQCAPTNKSVPAIQSNPYTNGCLRIEEFAMKHEPLFLSFKFFQFVRHKIAKFNLPIQSYLGQFFKYGCLQLIQYVHEECHMFLFNLDSLDTMSGIDLPSVHSNRGTIRLHPDELEEKRLYNALTEIEGYQYPPSDNLLFAAGASGSIKVVDYLLKHVLSSVMTSEKRKYKTITRRLTFGAVHANQLHLVRWLHQRELLSENGLVQAIFAQDWEWHVEMLQLLFEELKVTVISPSPRYSDPVDTIPEILIGIWNSMKRRNYDEQAYTWLKGRGYEINKHDSIVVEAGSDDSEDDEEAYLEAHFG